MNNNFDISNTKIFVISAPSGTGKTTLNRRLVKEHSNIEFSVSLTTRPIRTGETNGVHYNFVDRAHLEHEIASGRMLEWAEVFGNYYGTSMSEIERISRNNHITLLEIDVQGWQKAKQKIPHATSIFIIPPSIKELWNRLASRGTDSEEVRMRRILTARNELLCAKHFTHFVVNDDLEMAYKDLEDIMTHGKPTRLSTIEGLEYCENLIKECDTAEWLQEINKQYKLKKV